MKTVEVHTREKNKIKNSNWHGKDYISDLQKAQKTINQENGVITCNSYTKNIAKTLLSLHELNTNQFSFKTHEQDKQVIILLVLYTVTYSSRYHISYYKMGKVHLPL
jgi:chlorite dismutase